MTIPDPIPTYTYLVSRVRSLFPDLAYLHSTEPRIDGMSDEFQPVTPDCGSGNDFIREVWGPRPFLIDGGFTPPTALLCADKYPWDVVAFGRLFLANVGVLSLFLLV